VQLVQCWSFQLPDQESLAEQVKAWAWVVGQLRERGGIVKAAGREIEVPRGDEIEIAAIAVPPGAGQENTHAYEEALAAFQDTRVHELKPEDADQLGAHAAERLQLVS
jgi:hypothetical protein